MCNTLGRPTPIGSGLATRRIIARVFSRCLATPRMSSIEAAHHDLHYPYHFDPRSGSGNHLARAQAAVEHHPAQRCSPAATPRKYCPDANTPDCASHRKSHRLAGQDHRRLTRVFTRAHRQACPPPEGRGLRSASCRSCDYPGSKLGRRACCPGSDAVGSSDLPCGLGTSGADRREPA